MISEIETSKHVRFIHGLDSDGTVTARYPMRHEDSPARMLRALLELHSRTELHVSVAGTSTQMTETVSREAFYELDITKTSLPDVLTRLGRVVDWLIPLNNVEHLIGPAEPSLCLQGLDTEPGQSVLRTEVDMTNAGRYVRIEYDTGSSRRRIATIRTAGEGAEAWLIARICHEFLTGQDLAWRIEELRLN
jgi:hypothetical protein